MSDIRSCKVYKVLRHDTAFRNTFPCAIRHCACTVGGNTFKNGDNAVLWSRDAEKNVWIDTVLYFSAPNAKLKLSLRENDYVCASSEELMDFLENYKGSETLSKSRMDRIAKILKDATPK